MKFSTSRDLKCPCCRSVWREGEPGPVHNGELVDFLELLEALNNPGFRLPDLVMTQIAATHQHLEVVWRSHHTTYYWHALRQVILPVQHQ